MVCALMPTRPKPPPKELPPQEASDDWEWVSKSGQRALRVRYPRSKGKPEGDWFYAEQQPTTAPAPATASHVDKEDTEVRAVEEGRAEEYQA